MAQNDKVRELDPEALESACRCWYAERYNLPADRWDRFAASAPVSAGKIREWFRVAITAYIRAGSARSAV